MNTHEDAYLFAIYLAHRAREICLSHYNSSFLAEIKPDRSLVTAVDREIEEMIRHEALAKGYGIKGEEFGNTNLDTEYVIILDPIDGTNHFITRDGNFYTLIGIHHKTEGFVIGICDQPTVSDGFWTGVRGFGAAKHRKNDAGECNLMRMLNGSRCTFVSDAILASCNPLSIPGPDKYFYEALAEAAKASVPGGDAGNYARMAEGNVHIVLERVGGLYDLAALMPILKETGAVIKKLEPDGSVSDITFNEEGPMVVIAASTPELMESLLNIRSHHFALYQHFDRTMQGLTSGSRPPSSAPSAS